MWCQRSGQGDGTGHWVENLLKDDGCGKVAAGAVALIGLLDYDLGSSIAGRRYYLESRQNLDASRSNPDIRSVVAGCERVVQAGRVVRSTLEADSLVLVVVEGCCSMLHKGFVNVWTASIHVLPWRVVCL